MKITADQIAEQITRVKQLYPELLEDDEAWQLTLDSETNLAEFLSRVEYVRKIAAAHAKTLDGIIGDYAVRKARFDRRAHAMRSLAMKLLELADIKKAELAEVTYSITKVAPSVIITDAEAIPDEMCRFKREPNKEQIKESLRAGPVPGATMSNGGITLTVRTR